MTYEERVLMYQELDRDIVNFEGQDNPPYDPKYILTPDMKDSVMAEYDDLIRRTDTLEAPDPVFVILKSHFRDYLDGMKGQLIRTFANPAWQLMSKEWALSNYMRLDQRDEDSRFADFVKTADNVYTIWKTVRPYLNEVAQDDLTAFADACAGTAQDFVWMCDEVPEWFTGRHVDEAVKILKDLADAFLSWQKEIRDELITGEVTKQEEIPDDELIVKMPEGKYKQTLHDGMGVELDELLSWYEEENEKTRANVLKTAAWAIREAGVDEKDPTSVQEANDLLWKYAGPCDSPEEMFRRADSYLRRTRALAHEYVWLPEEEHCTCIKVPAQLRVSYPWGGYEDGGATHVRPIHGQMFLNQYNYEYVTDGWIKLNTLHEAYPGHHVQFVRRITDTLPETLKRGAKFIPLIEGVAQRTEKAFEWIFAEDPFFPVFVDYRRHHTSTRIKADLMLFYFGNTVEEVTQLYMDELGFSRTVARGQVQAQINMPGYFTCYYYGLKKLLDWEESYGYSKRDFTELVFSIGNMSMENVHRYLELTEEEKARFRHDFPSLRMDLTETFI